MQPIDDDCLPEAAAILSRGFPERTTAFWDAALQRLSAYRKAANVGPIGQMMMVGDAPVGVILTIESRRCDRADPRAVINLSSWYVDAKYRWLAPAMLQRIVADDSSIYTDLSPSPAARSINERLGFSVASEGTLLFFLPWAAVAGPAQMRVIPFEQLPAGALSTARRAMLAYHRKLGCVAAALESDGCYQPLLFSLTRRKGLPVARLVVAESRRLVAGSIAAIARFLLDRKALFLTIHADRDECVPGGFRWSRNAPVQVKGKWERGRVDHTFSELVFLQL
jgi:hypothetical protein